MHADNALNKRSRFVNVYICAACDAREAKERFFWRDLAEAQSLDIKGRS
jgi:hypothetical protein